MVLNYCRLWILKHWPDVDRFNFDRTMMIIYLFILIFGKSSEQFEVISSNEFAVL